MYECQHCKNAPPTTRFRRKYTWKTKRGYENHRCVLDDLAAVAERKQKELERAEAEKEALRQRIETARYKVGNPICYVACTVVAPTHEERWGRMVRVRYEEARWYEGANGIVTGHTMHGYLSGTTFVSENDIYPTIAEADVEAKKRQTAYRESVRQAEANR